METPLRRYHAEVPGDGQGGAVRGSPHPPLAPDMGCRAACVLAVLLAGLVPLGQGQEREKVKCYDSVRGTIYDYGALTIDGDEYIPFRKYAGKMVLFVNVATY